METKCSSETSISNYRTLFLYKPQNQNMNLHRRENPNLTHEIYWLWNYYWISSIVLGATLHSETEFASIIRCREGNNPDPLGLLGRDILDTWEKKDVIGNTNTLLQSNVMCGRYRCLRESIFLCCFNSHFSSISHTLHLAVADSVRGLRFFLLFSDREQLCLAGPTGQDCFSLYSWWRK
jgi:hypothetical protein